MALAAKNEIITDTHREEKFELAHGDQMRMSAKYLEGVSKGFRLEETMKRNPHHNRLHRYCTNLMKLFFGSFPHGRPKGISLIFEVSPSAASIGASTAQSVVPGD